jgi:hypothetical protein
VSRFTTHLGLVMMENAAGDPLLTSDGRCQWSVATPLTYDVGAEASGQTITVPAGAVTDLASIPRAAWSIGFPPDGPWLKAAVVHDSLYRRRGDVVRTGHPQPYTRAQSDGILREAMAVLGVGAFERFVIWSAVRLGGAAGWGS